MKPSDDTFPESDNTGLKVEELTRLAESAGLEAVDQSALMRFALAVAEQCAEIGDEFTTNDRNAGEAIRAYFGLG